MIDLEILKKYIVCGVDQLIRESKIILRNNDVQEAINLYEYFEYIKIEYFKERLMNFDYRLLLDYVEDIRKLSKQTWRL